MASLSNIVKTEETKDEEVQDISHVCFVSDTNPSKGTEFYDSLKLFDPVLFMNRDFAHMRTQNINYIWINISVPEARVWLSANLSKPDGYIIVSVYANQKKSKWLEDIPSLKSMRKSALDGLKALTIGELMNLIVYNSGIIHPPTNRILSCLGIGVRKLPKNED